MAWRRSLAIAAAAAAVGWLVLSPVTLAQGAAVPPWAAPPAVSVQPVAGCEQKLERAQRPPHHKPALAIVGASFTAGVGPGHPSQSWAAVLARRLHWDAVIYGDPGAGYVRAGAGRQGPVAAEIARVGLRALAPALVIVQAGHDDIGTPPALEQQRVEQAVAVIRAEAPHAQIALLTVFAGRSRSAAAYRTDHAIVTAGRAADRGVIIIDPLAAGWKFPRSPDGLHPTGRGDAWIAGQVAHVLSGYGVRPAPPQPAAVSCDWSIPAPPPRR